jgi:four helix bundle protein
MEYVSMSEFNSWWVEEDGQPYDDSSTIGSRNLKDVKTYNLKHRAFYFAKDVIEFVKEVEVTGLYSSLFEQLIRCATSIGANLVEGAAGSSRRDWLKFTVIALKSANEVKYWLCLIKDTQKVNMDLVVRLINEANELSNILGAIVLKAKKEGES